jgi:hypothetical protein
MDELYDKLFGLYQYYYMYECFKNKDADVYRQRINQCAKIILEIEDEFRKSNDLKIKLNQTEQRLQMKKADIKSLYKRLLKFHSSSKAENEVIKNLAK